jgi:hypothetical protein
MTYSPGPVVFRHLLREWRAGSMAEVLVRDDLDVELDDLEREAAAGVAR